jgi:hypothetical protein
MLWGIMFAAGIYLMARLSSHELVALDYEGMAYIYVSGLLIVPIPAALGALADRQITGIFAGVGIWLFVVVAMWILFSNAAI